MSDNNKQYIGHDIEALDDAGNYYSRHVNAMTAENLFLKSDIAAELGYRDKRIDELLAALEEKDQRIKDLEGDVRFERLRLNETEIAALIKRADAAEQREEHLKATADVLSAKNTELEQRLQQPIKLPPLMPENIFGGTPQAHMVANSHNNAITACSMSIRDAGFKSECTVWKEAKE